jgi:hypothetical protein
MASLTSSPLFITKPLASLKWFSPEPPDIPQFMLDKLEELTRWEKAEGET